MRSTVRAVVAVAAALVVAPAGVATADVVDIARRAGIALRARTFSVAPHDFNRDGRADFFLVRHNPDNPPDSIPTSILYRGRRRGGFTRFAARMFGRSDKHGCDWAYVNRDRRPDLFCTVGLTRRSKNELWIQRRGHTFVNRARRWGLTRNTHGHYRYATFIRANNDRRPDLYVARYKEGCRCGLNDADRFPNELWINTGSRFRRARRGVAKPISAKKDNASCAQAADFDKDGDQDLLVCGSKALHLYANRNGRRFRDVTRRKRIRGRGTIDARLVDLNGDRDLDLVKLTSTRVTARYGRRRARFGRPRLLARTRAGMGLAFGRFDRNRTLDVYVLSGSGAGGPDQPDRILLKRRGRVGYRVIRINGVRSGAGDDVAALRANRRRGVEFLVTNGDKKRTGPMQLFTWRRR